MFHLNLNKEPEPPLDPTNRYTWMQKEQYAHLASQVWDNEYSPEGELLFNRIEGRFKQHCDWEGYEKFFKNIEDTSDKTALDFGCGLGRNILCYHNRFKQLDGVDLCASLLEQTAVTLKRKDINNCKLMLCNGIDLSEIPDNSYDLILSSRCLQHICVYSIRYNYLEEFYRVLKPGGKISIQMSYGKGKLNQVGYYRNHWNASGTGGVWDVCIKNPIYIKKDLKTFIGFKNFEFDVVLAPPYGMADDRLYIFFRAEKPE